MQVEPHWAALDDYAQRFKRRSLLSLFDDKSRADRFVARSDGGIFLDYSKTNIDEEGRALLVALARAVGLEQKRDAMFAGAKINETENRAVLHVALRNLSKDFFVDGRNVMVDVRMTYERMKSFAKKIRDGQIRGEGGKITDIINIGIGGSDLGPAMATLALAPYADGPRCHFLSNIDGANAADILKNLNPATTFVIVASKTFTTIETMTNAQTVREWMGQSVRSPEKQFAAVSTALDKTKTFGINSDYVFGFEDWVGGRYSLWGPIGLSIMLAIGGDYFDEFLAGGAAMDEHFLTADLVCNMPVMLALIGIWHHQICGYATRAVLPYDQRLSRLPAYFQQLEMESNGKSVQMDGSLLKRQAGPIVWGEPGTNGQHAFYQLTHQGTQVVPCEFMIARRAHEKNMDPHHLLLVANCLAQSEALMCGRSLDQARKLMAASGFEGDERERQAHHRVFSGNRPSTTLGYDLLSPFVLGQIIALYEHRVFVEGSILGINSYDQWGVELGKELALSLIPILEGKKDATQKDGSTAHLTQWYRG